MRVLRLDYTTESASENASVNVRASGLTGSAADIEPPNSGA